MKVFRTPLPPLEYPSQINYPQSLLSLGSCFAEHIGSRLQTLQLPMLLNPFGILFNPLSIAQNLQHLLHKKTYRPTDLFEHQGLWHSFDHHSAFSHPDPQQALQRIQQSIDLAHAQLQQLDWLFITLGTAYVFKHQTTERIVANCHKLPANQFHHYRLSPATIYESLAPVISDLKELRPNLQIVLSISPVRHLRTGIMENQRSKAALLLAQDALCRDFKDIHYFPAYEIVLDELRDYRFYATDYAHPSEEAIEYIWTRFQQSLCSPTAQQIMKEIEPLLKSSQHRPRFPHSPQHQQFKAKQLIKVDELERKYPFLKLKGIRARFE